MSRAEYQREWAKNNRDKKRRSHDAWVKKNPQKYVDTYNATNRSLHGRWARRRSTANKNGVAFTISEEEMGWPTTCPCGKDISGVGAAHLDKVDPSLGYVPGNIEWLCPVCNRRKSDLTYEEMLSFAQAGIARHSAKKR